MHFFESKIQEMRWYLHTLLFKLTWKVHSMEETSSVYSTFIKIFFLSFLLSSLFSLCSSPSFLLSSPLPPSLPSPSLSLSLPLFFSLRIQSPKINLSPIKKRHANTQTTCINSKRQSSL